MKRTVLLLLTVLALSIGTAKATQQGNDAITKWKAMDKCARQAQAANSDFSPDSNAKRDEALKRCLNFFNLPPREPMAPPPSPSH